MPYNEVQSGNVWKPEEVGAKLEGTKVGSEKLMGQNNSPYTSFHIENLDTGTIMKVSGAVLEEKLGVVEDGQRVLITYKGKVKTKKGNYAKDFSVMVWSDDDKPAL